MKTIENIALNYSVELLFDENPIFNNNYLLEKLNMSFNNVNILFSTKNLVSFVFNDYISITENIEIPVQIIVIKEYDKLNFKKINNSVNQTFDWENAQKAVDSCKYSLVISDFMATELKYSDRIYLFNKFLKTILEVLPVKAIHWSYSQKMVEPEEYKSALDYESLFSLYGIINVRYFIIDSFYLMDTIGLSALGLPDLQCKFKNIDTGIIATILYDLAYNIFEKGDYIKDGEIIEILKIKFKCLHEFSKAKPQRIILNLITI